MNVSFSGDLERILKVEALMCGPRMARTRGMLRAMLRPLHWIVKGSVSVALGVYVAWLNK